MTGGEQPGLWDANAAGAEGLERAVRAAGPDWLAVAKVAVYRCCLARETLICDDVWATGLESCGHDRAFGEAMKYGQRAGWMKKTGKMRPSVRSHGSAKPEYRSLIFQP